MKRPRRLRVHSWLGLSGVDESEAPRAQFWARIFEIPTLALAIWIIVVWYLETRHQLKPLHSRQLDYGIWLYFVAETGLLLYLVRDRWNYLRGNWLNVVIIITGVPILWSQLPFVAALRSLRLLIFVGLLLSLSSSVRKILMRNHLGATLVVTALLVVISGYFVAGIDPAFKTPSEGIWWAWVTISGVGYGDLVPQSTEGRVFASILIAASIALYAIVTANISVFLISLAERKGDIGPTTTADVERVEKTLARIEDRLGDIERRIDELQDKRKH